MYEDTAAAAAKAEPINHFVEINDLKLHYLDWGGDPDKHTLLLVHGGSAHAHWWDDVAPQLTPYGHVIALDFRGHGRSQWADPPNYGLEIYLQELVGFISQHLQTRVVLVGHSMGGHVAQLLADDRPDLLEALIAIDSPPNGPPLATRLKWRWKRRKQGGPRPEFNSAQDLIKRFRLSPPGHALTQRKLKAWRFRVPSNYRMGNGRFASIPRPACPAPRCGECAGRVCAGLACRCWSCAEPKSALDDP